MTDSGLYYTVSADVLGDGNVAFKFPDETKPYIQAIVGEMKSKGLMSMGGPLYYQVVEGHDKVTRTAHKLSTEIRKKRVDQLCAKHLSDFLENMCDGPSLVFCDEEEKERLRDAVKKACNRFLDNTPANELFSMAKSVMDDDFARAASHAEILPSHPLSKLIMEEQWGAAKKAAAPIFEMHDKVLQRAGCHDFHMDVERRVTTMTKECARALFEAMQSFSSDFLKGFTSTHGASKTDADGSHCQ